jgi:hypothetical protein
MSKKYIELRVSGNEPELESFLSLVHLIESFGRYGMCRKIEVTVDGDGSGKLTFYEKNADKEYVELPTFELDDLHKLEESVKNKYVIDIGE